ncbi:hypothetical protein GA0116948_10744 [Chitinophaga costaii]|uniref:Ketoreductase domain-containing protein n=1 Tax=Chitinophaga costaii TaxID=1335309 RepID=A0A1C4E269_9BACT|nr:SDR family oxidoreductase [Chitinophaga costaii]PUZ24361.1 KR domain-containing protein [Chitinophaga costaii]SCC37704.1 hypothetical protein GA0116948_10744 [Chitinophaga costaii]
MSDFKDRVVLITGGASGIGKIMGRLALEKGAAHLVVWDRDATALHTTAAEWEGAITRLHTRMIDITHTPQLAEACNELLAELGKVDILINNAGMVAGKLFQDHTPADIDNTMQVNALACMHLTRLLLPGMLARRQGHVCNIASAAGFIANPRLSVYCASKWAVIGWSESLRLEMEQQRSGVRVTTVAPYYINTGMFAGVRSLIPILEPEFTARQIVRAVERNRIFIKLPWVINLLPLAKGILPIRWFDWLVGKALRTHSTMKHFTGRPQ